MDQSFKGWVFAAGGRPEVRAAVDEVYADLQREVDIRRPICIISGRCCRFDEFGHRLFVTTMELGTFVYGLPETAESDLHKNPGGCPFQTRKMCGVHSIRPFGCRVFFCDATSDDWQREMYEKFHARLKLLHGEMDVPYVYMEWREALEKIWPILSHSAASGHIRGEDGDAEPTST